MRKSKTLIKDGKITSAGWKYLNKTNKMMKENKNHA